MTDIILSGQQQYSQKFFLPSVNKGKIVEDFFPEIPPASTPGFWRKMRLGPVGSVAAGGMGTYQIPSHGMIGDLIAEVSLGATGGGNYAPFPAAALITNVRIAHGGNELHNYPYRPFWQFLQSLSPNELKTRFQNAAGASGAGAAVIGYAPIGAFWTSFKHEKNDFPVPLPIMASSQYLQVEITLDTIANILASGGSGGSLTTMNLLYWEFIVDGSKAAAIINSVQGKDWNRYGYDWQVVPATTVATGTSAVTAVNLSGLQGDIKEIVYYGVTSTNNDTNHSYFACQNLVYVDLTVDGTSIYQSITGGANELIMDQLIFNQSKVGADATYGLPYCLNFSRRRDAHSWDGALNSNIYKQLLLNVEQSSGGNVYVNVIATMNRYYIFSNGLFQRVK